ncbi:RNA polymerase sigma factor [Anaerobacillus isosaccharinicus]|uniref:RNA polymerase sigma factor n=1 Tax=Anaerobacillus isosaccharinicus TaxID=1532552 RepID=A0A1S2L8U3_9BACI|nr:RNA polymerase sigma factor [Anaerobacillus isosaccharinicus]MBA5588660.1 RNA polymerase sigma factor [Anaerobacillus isosaccharinicus]QOY37934.1 RNA polymerase sigma factor [Anaerobacillus isosaccharinicus]
MTNSYDKEIIQQLYDDYLEEVYQYCLYFTNNQSEAEDLTQDTFIKVMKNLHSFQGKSSAKTWILSIARHTTIDHFRKRKVSDFLPELFSRFSATPYGIPEAQLDHLEEWEQLQWALLKLKPDFRNVVILRGLKELSIKETAEVLNWKETKVKVDYHRALKQLQNYISKNKEGGFIIHEDAK